MADLIDHDTFVAEIQKDVVEAVKEYGWTLSARSCWEFDVSLSHLKKIYDWRPLQKKGGQASETFNLDKLLNAHRWAKDAIAKCPRNNPLPF